ncbi:MAG TPA: hypothetical protein VFB62_14825 [Polyangiaceae bacterium]|nr:hypothetical protein [Polyangiaceae bacterium]
MRWAVLMVCAVVCACSSPHATEPADAPVPSAPAMAQPAPATAVSASAEPAAQAPRIAARRALELMYHGEAPSEARACLEKDSIECLLRLRLGEDEAAVKLAIDLYNETGTVVGMEREHVMDGGWRGHIRLVPYAPVGRERRHLEWLVGAHRDFKNFFSALEQRGELKRYRWQPIELRFFQSVGRTTPSAYAADWGIAYNVSGSLHKSADAVRETLFHEVFHLNDAEHGDWSRKHLTPIFDSIMQRCGANTGCLAPFAPGDTMVRGGTFYAFQPGNGVWEYAAELAVRYYQEHREIVAGRALAKRPFKCGPDENARAWRLFVDEFFGGIDATPSCGQK